MNSVFMFVMVINKYVYLMLYTSVLNLLVSLYYQSHMGNTLTMLCNVFSNCYNCFFSDVNEQFGQPK